MPISSSDAEKMVQAAKVKAQELGIRVSVAVADNAGNLVALSRMDGASPVTVGIAEAMAYTSAVLATPGAQMVRWADAPWFRSLVIQSQGRILPADGGLPIQRGGEVVGAVGVSGGSNEQDLQCSQAGLAAIQ